jgi:hypothetical protein
MDAWLERGMVDPKLIDDCRAAMDAYEAAKAGLGCRTEAFLRFLVAERVLLVCMGRVHQSLEELRARYWA